MQEFDFVSPHTLKEACRALADGGLLVAGGTDVIPQILSRRLRSERLVDLSRLHELNCIEDHGEWISIGALTTYSELVESTLLQAEAPALVQAAATVGCLQTRNRGTLGGNIGNASPAGDSLPPLLIYDAHVTLSHVNGERRLPLKALLLGPGQTDLAPGEVIREVAFKRLPGTYSLFLKLGSRQGMAVSVVSVAVAIGLDEGGRVSVGRLALGAVAPAAIRAEKAEALLQGQPLTEENINAAAEMAGQECTPISDVRGTADYRRHAVRVLVRRGLRALASRV